MNRDAEREGPTPSERESLSALVDGELPAGEAAAAVRNWASHESLRGDWHCHQVIGDALRSEELAGRGDEARFLTALRTRMAAEPVVLAPSPAQPVGHAASAASVPATGSGPARRRIRWAGGAAIAAGFAAVAGVLLSLGNPMVDNPAASQLVSAPGPSLTPSGQALTVPVEWSPGSAGGKPAAAVVPSALGPMIRDARIDAYLDAHRQLGPASWMAIPTAATQPQADPASR